MDNNYKADYSYDEIKNMKPEEYIDKLQHRLKEKFGKVVFEEDEFTQEFWNKMTFAIADFYYTKNDAGEVYSDSIGMMQDETLVELLKNGKL